MDLVKSALNADSIRQVTNGTTPMTTTYRLDRQVAKVLSERCASVLEEVRNSTPEASLEFLPTKAPSTNYVHSLIDTAFWASLKTEEARYHKFSVALSPVPTAQEEPAAYLFHNPLPFTSGNLAKLAPALNDQGISIGVWPDNTEQLTIWGFVPNGGWHLSVEVFAPGQLLTSFLYTGKALITGSEIKFIHATKFSLIRAVLNGMALKTASPNQFYKSITVAHSRQNDLEEIARSMLSHGHGGTLELLRWGKFSQAIA